MCNPDPHQPSVYHLTSLLASALSVRILIHPFPHVPSTAPCDDHRACCCVRRNAFFQAAEHEIRMVRPLRHPNIVRFLGTEQVGEFPPTILRATVLVLSHSFSPPTVLFASFEYRLLAPALTSFGLSRSHRPRCFLLCVTQDGTLHVHHVGITMLQVLSPARGSSCYSTCL